MDSKSLSEIAATNERLSDSRAKAKESGSTELSIDDLIDLDWDFAGVAQADVTVRPSLKKSGNLESPQQ